MARTKKKAVKDTVTFTKDELVKKVKAFLEKENACNGDWLNKIRIEFLGQKTRNVVVDVMIPATYQLEVASDGLPTKEEVAEEINRQLDDGDFDGFGFDESNFEVKKITTAE